MRAVAIIACLVTMAVAFPALAEVRPERTKPSWSETKRAELRAERDWLRAENRRLRRVLRHRPSVQEAIRLASIAYKVPPGQMRSVAWCESRFNPRADNPTSTATGLMQFLTSTYAATPYRDVSIESPYANALAAGWLWSRSGTWSHWAASRGCHGLR